MRIQVRFFTVLREMTERRTEDIVVRDDANVRDALKLLSEKYGDEFQTYVFEGDNLREHIHLLLDGVNVMTFDGLETKLKEDSTLAIVPPVGGGFGQE